MTAAVKIMIVDDDPVLRLVAGEILRQHGYDVSEAEDGAEAIRQLEVSLVDLAVIDMLMPNKEGIETIQEIRQRWPDIRLVAISGGGKGLNTSYLLAMAKTFGAEAVYQKPIRATGFLDIVTEVLSAPSSARALG